MIRNRIHTSKSIFQRHSWTGFLLLFFLFPIISQAQVSSAVDTTSIRIGEEIIYSIQVEANETDLVLFPEGPTFNPLEVIESYTVDTLRNQDKINLIKKYGLTQFDSGAYTIPAQRVVINNKPFNTDSVTIAVANVVVDTTKQKMYHIKPALEVAAPPFAFSKVLAWLVVLLFLAGIVGLLLFRRKKKRREAKQQLPPYEEALEALKILDNSHFLKNDNSKKYYSALTEIIKKYLHREVDDSALESTTNELIERLYLLRDSGNFEFDTDTIKKLDSILKRADLIKFAKMKEQEGQAKADRSIIEEIINETKEIIPEPTEEELLQNELYLEELHKKEKRKKIKKIISVAVSVAIMTLSVNIALQGWDAVRDSLFGNKTKSLSEGRWIKSEYGTPQVIIETPKVLVRTQTDTNVTKSPLVKETHAFVYGSLEDKLFIKVSTLQFNQEQEIELDKALDAALTILENEGAKNLVVKRDDFETENGIKGVKAYGDFHVQVSENKVLKETSKYELLIFAQGNGLQKILIAYQDDGRFAEGIKERIISSIELEVTEQKQKNEQ